MVCDRLGDRRILSIVQRVIAPHETLQFRELTDHAGRKIGLREKRGAAGAFGIGAEHMRHQELAKPCSMRQTLSRTLPSRA